MTQRSPLRVAVMTFGAVVLVGTLISFAIVGGNGWMTDQPFGRGERIGQGLGVLAVACAAVAYLVQRKRVTRSAADTRPFR